MSRSEHVAVIGAGLMGHGIAQIFAEMGNEVFLYDLNPEILLEAKDKIRANLTFLAEKGVGNREDIEPAIERIHVGRTVKEAVSEARFVVEAVVEKLSVKQDLFKEMEEFCSAITVLATNTSVISITEIAAKTKRKERVVGTHFWNPPYLIPLVEVVPGRETSSDVVDYTYRLLQSVGKRPVKVKKDVPGFVGNRLQHALWREAISIVEHGIADPEMVDEVIKSGFGIRLPVLGPLENIDMIGLDLTFQIHDYILPHIEKTPNPSPMLNQKQTAGELGFKTGKGFYEWSQEAIKDCRQKLIEHLVRWNKEGK